MGAGLRLVKAAYGDSYKATHKQNYTHEHTHKDRQCSSVVERLLHMHKAQGQGGGGRGSRMAQQANVLASKTKIRV